MSPSLSILGQVISALRETGLLNNTVVIFTADHGDLAMEHRQFYKMSMFEGSSHVPLLIMGPGLMSGLQLNQPVSLVDLYPTVLGKERQKQGTCGEYRGKILFKNGIKAKTCILSKWIAKDPPIYSHWVNELNCCLERVSYNIRGRPQKFWKVWQPWIDSLEI